jgi:hypothetical protein
MYKHTGKIGFFFLFGKHQKMIETKSLLSSLFVFADNPWPEATSPCPLSKMTTIIKKKREIL